jgi:hypothetical protein
MIKVPRGYVLNHGKMIGPIEGEDVSINDIIGGFDYDTMVYAERRA